MKILVTGGAGFIGSHVCKALAARGDIPIAYDNFSRGPREAVKFGPLVEGDIADKLLLKQVLADHKPQAVMHFAGFAYVAESVQQPLLYYRTNVAGSIALIEALLESGPRPFIFSSTAAVYGIPSQSPISENHPLQPINPYGFSKLIIEQFLQHLGVSHELPWMALRYFNAAGADADGEIGNNHVPETRLIPLALRAALGGAPLSIYGTDYDTPDGTCIRDYVHVMDIADAHLRALDHLLHGGKSVALNLGNARGYSIKEVIAAAEQVCGKSISVSFETRRPGEPPRLVGSALSANSILGWSPKRSELKVQIADAWKWERTRSRRSVAENAKS